MKYLKDLVLAVLAGFAIGIGGILFLSTDNKYIGSLFFTIGLFMVCTRDYNLFTGKVGYIFDNKPKYLLFLLICWIGNFIGTFLSSALIHLTRFSDAYTQQAQKIVEGKLGGSLLSAFVLAIFCNILMYVGVDGFKKNPHEFGKYLGLFFAVFVFIIAGFEHSVADMFYFAAAKELNLKALGFILIVTLGNVVGGVLFPLAGKLAKRLGGKEVVK